LVAGDDPPPPYTATDDSATKIDEFAGQLAQPAETSFNAPPILPAPPGYPVPPEYAAALYYPSSATDAPPVILQPQPQQTPAQV